MLTSTLLRPRKGGNVTNRGLSLANANTPAATQGWEWQVGFPSSPMWRWSIQYIPQVIPYAALTVDGCLWYHVILFRCFKALSTSLWRLLVRRSIRQKMPRTIANEVLSTVFSFSMTLKKLHGSEIIAGEAGCHQVPAFHCATCLIFFKTHVCTSLYI